MLLLDLLVQLLQTFILRRETAFRGGVDDEDDFALVFFEGNGLAFLCSRTTYQYLFYPNSFHLCANCIGRAVRGGRRTVKRLEIVEAGSRSHISFLSLRDLISLYGRTGSPLLLTAY